MNQVKNCKNTRCERDVVVGGDGVEAYDRTGKDQDGGKNPAVGISKAAAIGDEEEGECSKFRASALCSPNLHKRHQEEQRFRILPPELAEATRRVHHV